MARMNVEEKWWSDPRRGRLILLLKNHLLADGAMLNAWKLAERYWVPDRKLIPLNVWEEAEMPEEIFTVSLATREEFGIKVRGIEDEFEWRSQRREAGRKGGKQKQANSSKTLQDQTNLPSSSSSSSNTNTKDATLRDELENSFGKLYASYPKRPGGHRKKDALKTFKAKFSSQPAQEKLAAAITHYVRICETEKITGTNFVKQFATFVNGGWEDFAGPADPDKKPWTPPVEKSWDEALGTKSAPHVPEPDFNLTTPPKSPSTGGSE